MSASHPYPILDSHIHLCPGPSLDTLAWHDSHLPPGSPPNPLSAKAFSVSQFRDAVRRSPVLGRSVRGAIVVESDRWTEDHARDKAPQNDDGATEEDIDSVPDEKLKQRWSGPLAELAFLSRLVAGKPEPLDDFVPSDSGIVAAIVAWAPVSSGPKVLARYLRIARDVAGDDCWTRVKGFRFLLQDKPPRTMLRRQFVEGVAFLATKGYTFDVGVDHHRRGRQQLDECVEMVGRVQDLLKERGENPATFILSR